MENLPFKDKKIPVQTTSDEVEIFLTEYPNAIFCFYLADKDEAAWEKSTSRVYFNQILENFIYLPIQIQENDGVMLETIYDIAKRHERVIAINQTSPYKTNFVLDEWFPDRLYKSVDSLVKNKGGIFELLSINTLAFQKWFEEEIGKFKKYEYIVIGDGEIGTPIKELLVTQGQKLKSLSEELSHKTVIINAAKKEGVKEQPELEAFMKTQDPKKHIYIDLLPQKETATTKLAQELGWKAYTGSGITQYNNYLLLEAIADRMEEDLLSFKKFQKVAENVL